MLSGSQNSFSSILQVNAATGAATGVSLGVYTNPSVFVYGGRIRTSSDGKTLFYGDFGTSPSYEYQLNVGGPTPSIVWSASLGGNGKDVTLSRDGSLMAFGEGGNAHNEIIGTANDAVIGSIGSGSNIAFSPDDAFAYASNQFQGGIFVDSLSSFTQTGAISTVGNPQQLFVDNSARYLFSDEVGDTQIYATGRTLVPEPAGLSLVGIAAIGLLSRRKIMAPHAG